MGMANCTNELNNFPQFTISDIQAKMGDFWNSSATFKYEVPSLTRYCRMRQEKSNKSLERRHEIWKVDLLVGEGPSLVVAAVAAAADSEHRLTLATSST